MAGETRKLSTNDQSFKEDHRAKPVLITELDNNIAIWKININALQEQEKNARSQPPEVFNRLKDTMKRDDRLESLPFVANSGDGVQIISGHHRVRAARMAGLQEIYVMADTRELSRSQVVSKQLAHNALQGQDDTNILAQLFQEMDDIEDRLESGVDPRLLELLNMEPVPIQAVGVDFTTRIITFAFLPSKFNDFEELVKRINKDTHMVGAIDIETFDKFRDTISRVSNIEDIRSIGSIVSRMIDLTNDQLDHVERENEQTNENESTEATG